MTTEAEYSEKKHAWWPPVTNSDRTPRFSILLPTRNRREWLPRAIESVQAQTFPNWELIVLDNGNERDERVADLMPRDPRVKYRWAAQVTGVSDALNRALGFAKGELIVTVADDDRLPPETLQVYNDKIGDADWLVAVTEIHDGYHTYLRGGTKENLEMTRQGDYMLGGATCWRRDFLNEHGPWDPAFNFAPDVDLADRLLKVSEPLLTEDVCYWYTDHPKTMSHINIGEQSAQAKIVRER